jgi:hypothetical protein
MQAESATLIHMPWLRRKLNKLGTFSLSQLGKSKSPIAEFMRNARKTNDNFEESLLKLVCPLPAFTCENSSN